MDKQEAVKIFDLVVKKHLLPATLDKLVPMSFMGAAAVKFYQAKVKLMDQLGATEEQRKATLADGQDAGEMLLNIEAKIGELYDALPSAKNVTADHRPARGRQNTIEDAGISNQRANTASNINREMKKPGGGAVAAIIKEARENDDIPTKTAVLNKIRADKAQAAAERYRDQVESQKEENTAATRGEALTYLSKLREVVLILPAEIPSDGWTSSSFAEARSMVKLIMRRLEKWQELPEGESLWIK